MPKSLILLLLFPLFSLSQTLIGTVKDSLGNPLQNANVIAKPLVEKQGLKFAIADNKGRYKLELEKEKNTFNNTKNFAVEVIDQKTNIALISSISHPDIGVIKRAIETNAQRKVTIVNPKEIKSLEEYNILILYVRFKLYFQLNV